MILSLSVRGTTNEFIGKAGQKEVPEGLKGSDASDFNHLSEGADIYPYEGLVVLKSQTTGVSVLHIFEKIEERLKYFFESNKK